MAKSTMKQMLLDFISRYQQIRLRIMAMETILNSCPQTKLTWKVDVEVFVSEKKLQRNVRAEFAAISKKIDAASEETALAELLARFPIEGKAN